MKISRDKLLHMIKESISRVLLKEYGGEQLVLPYDGDTRAYNYMQYVDFIKSLTKPGEITSNVHNIDEYYKKFNINSEALFDIGVNANFYDGYAREEFNDDEYEVFIDELEDKYGDIIYGENSNPLSVRYGIGEELSSEGFKYFANKLIESAKYEFSRMLGELFKYCVDGMLYMNRELVIPAALNRLESDNYNSLYELLQHMYSDLGYYWAYGIDTGCAYCAKRFEGGTSTVSLIAMTPIENVDMSETCALCGVGEHEVRLHDDTKIMLVGLKIDGKEINIGHRVYK